MPVLLGMYRSLKRERPVWRRRGDVEGYDPYASPGLGGDRLRVDLEGDRGVSKGNDGLKVRDPPGVGDSDRLGGPPLGVPDIVWGGV